MRKLSASVLMGIACYLFLPSTNAAAQYCIIPIVEQTQATGYYTLAMRARFLQTIASSDGASLDNRQVVEFTSDIGQDSCYFPGSTLPQYPGVSGGTWTVGVNGHNVWGPDDVGYGKDGIDYIRAYAPQHDITVNEDVGCGYVIYQGLKIECDANLFFAYVKNNRISATVYSDHEDACREENMTPFGKACKNVPY